MKRRKWNTQVYTVKGRSTFEECGKVQYIALIYMYIYVYSVLPNYLAEPVLCVEKMQFLTQYLYGNRG
jgi:hypothetical protein